ncbi:hypothetical protein DEU56DRAFT_812155 [Suillus clintonianus]|uniref:uncharacterized protein n=1 Tax=Suillus clintonianus TaxID=1904413 RepID=UPI001B86E094|nr:uncharacterized protein DEU56DRAFT_812155 [Suillus clintonianus]KAG2132808.1 hypothetical protein DEU56DRAFT_812155 [Suillus clintonianus]
MDSSLACMFHSLLYAIIEFFFLLDWYETDIGLTHSHHGLISGTHFNSSHFLLDIVTFDLFSPFLDMRRTTGLIFIMDSSLACMFILYIIFFDFFLDWYETISDSFSFITYLSLCGIDLSFLQFF